VAFEYVLVESTAQEGTYAVHLANQKQCEVTHAKTFDWELKRELLRKVSDNVRKARSSTQHERLFFKRNGS